MRHSGDGVRTTSRTSERRGSSDQRLRRASSGRRGSRSSSAQRRPSQTDNASVRSDGKLSAEEVAEALYKLENESSDESSTDDAFEKKPERPSRSGKKKTHQPRRDDAAETDPSGAATSQTESMETASEKENMKTLKEKDEKKHRGNIADLTKYRRHSDTPRSSSRNSSSSSTSVGHSSVSSGSMISISKRRMSLQPSNARRGTEKKRTRSQSVEFRLGDFALLLNKGDEQTKKSGDNVSSSSESIKSPKLEADIISLRALQKEREKRKKERMKRQKAKKRKSRSKKQVTEHTSELDVSGLGDLGSSDEANNLVDTLTKLALRRKGTVSPLASINKNTLQKLQALHAVSLTDKEKQDRASREKQKAEQAKKPLATKIDYSDLSFEQKLLEDDRRLMLVSTLPEAREVLMDTEAVSMNKMLPRQIKALPSIPREQSCTISIDKPRFAGYNLGEANYRVMNKLLMNAVLSDKLAGWPWVKFLNRYSYTSEVRYVRFWHTAQEYINLGLQRKGAPSDRMRHRLAFELINVFLIPTGNFLTSNFLLIIL